MSDIKREKINIADFYDETFQAFLRSVRYGKNELRQVFFKEDLIFDDEWITTIEDLLFSVEKISKNPMRSIRDELELTVVEKAKHISNKTIRHLAANSKDVAKYEDGKITPRKVLTKHMEEDISIYENRLIYTLVGRLIVFMESRYRKIKKSIDSREITRLKVTSNFKVGKNDVKCNIAFDVSEPRLVTQSGDNNTALLERVEIIRRRLRIIQGTAFYKELAKSKPINPPIIKTNALLMNRDYNNAYKLWLFISAYRESGFTVNVSEKQFTFDKDYYDDLTSLVALGLRTMIANNATREKRFAKIRPRATRVKRYRLGDDILYEGSYRRESTKKASEEVVNEYYYQAIKEQLIKSSILKEEPQQPEVDGEKLIEYERRIEATFGEFFKALMKINNELFLEKQGLNQPRADYGAVSSVEEIKTAIKEQRSRYNKARQLASLKLQDLRAELRREGDEIVALQLLYSRLAMLQQKSYKRIILEEDQARLEILQKAETVVQKADALRDAHLERALNRLKASETKRRLLQLKDILSNSEEEVRTRLLEDFEREIYNAESKTHELKATLEEKLAEKQLLEEQAASLEQEVAAIGQANQEYITRAKAELEAKLREQLDELEREEQEHLKRLAEKQQEFANLKAKDEQELADKHQEHLEELAKEEQKLAALKVQNEQELERKRQEIDAHIENLKADNEKVYSEGLAKAEASKQDLLAALKKRQAENQEYIAAQANAIAQKLRKDLADLEVQKAQNEAHIGSLVLQIETEKTTQIATLKAKQEQNKKEFAERSIKIEKDVASKNAALEEQLASELAKIAKKDNVNREYIRLEKEKIEQNRIDALAELAEIQAQNKHEMSEQEKKINNLYEEEQLRLELLAAEQEKQIIGQEQSIREEYKREKAALTSRRKAYHKQLKDMLMTLDTEISEADKSAQRLLEGKLSLYPVDNFNRVYKYIVEEKSPSMDIRQNRVSRASKRTRASSLRKWQVDKNLVD